MKAIAFVISIVCVRPAPCRGRSEASSLSPVPWTAVHDDAGSGVTADVRAVAPPTVTARTTPRSTVPIAELTRIRFLTRPPVSFELPWGCRAGSIECRAGFRKTCTSARGARLAWEARGDVDSRRRAGLRAERLRRTFARLPGLPGPRRGRDRRLLPAAGRRAGRPLCRDRPGRGRGRPPRRTRPGRDPALLAPLRRGPPLRGRRRRDLGLLRDPSRQGAARPLERRCLLPRVIPAADRRDLPAAPRPRVDPD